MTINPVSAIAIATLILSSAPAQINAEESATESALIVISGNSITGKKHLVINKGQAVIWTNRTARNPIQITIRNYPYQISPHPLTINFTSVENNLTTHKLMPAGTIAGYFFDHSGEFTYEITGNNLILKGTVTVK